MRTRDEIMTELAELDRIIELGRTTRTVAVARCLDRQRSRLIAELSLIQEQGVRDSQSHQDSTLGRLDSWDASEATTRDAAGAVYATESERNAANHEYNVSAASYDRR